MTTEDHVRAVKLALSLFHSACNAAVTSGLVVNCRIEDQTFDEECPPPRSYGIVVDIYKQF